MSDLWTMMWKEVKDGIFQGGWQALVRPLIFIGVLGIVLPMQFGGLWLAFTPTVPLLVFASFVFILNYIGDAIAGEHERHTLETLLASRISDWAILLGKVLVAVGYTWGMVLVCLLLGPCVVYLTKGAGVWAFYTPSGVLPYALALSLLTCLLAASGGVLVSLHASTVRQAQQTLTLSTLVAVCSEWGSFSGYKPCRPISFHPSTLIRFCSLSWWFLSSLMRSWSGSRWPASSVRA
jgi:ABC-2 type transport system permease protein